MPANRGFCAKSGRVAGQACALAFATMVVSAQSAGATGSAPSLILSPSADLHDGESVSVSVGANGFFTPNAHVNILECSDPGGSQANLPKSDSSCDGNTIQGNTVLIAANGSFSDPSYTLYALPSSALGEQANAQPVCNQSNPCVLYVGENQNDFTAPKVFSAPFSIQGSSAGSTTSSTGGSTTTVTSVAPSSTSTSVTSAVDPSASLATTAASDSGSLANTGPPTEILWLAALGATFFVTGTLGRRISKARR
jgi:hypothetical protein